MLSNLIYGLTVLLVVVTAAPLLPVGWWFVRLWDFPRVQVACIALVTGLGLAGLVVWEGEWTLWPSLALCVLTAVVLWQVSLMLPFTRLWRVELPAGDPDAEQALRLVVANVCFENEQRELACRAIMELDCDLLLMIEIDEHWDRALEPYRKDYPHRSEHIAGEGVGICLWSRLPIERVRVKYLVSDKRASIHAAVRDRVGERFEFVGVHPTPPALADKARQERHDSRIRDAELMMIAKAIEGRADEGWVVAGDLNDVAWSHTTRLFKRISGMKDPRVGRGMYNTFHAQRPLMRYPLDHVFLSATMRILRIARHRVPGSDHFAMLAEIQTGRPSNDPSPQTRPDASSTQEANEIIEEGVEDTEGGKRG